MNGLDPGTLAGSLWETKISACVLIPNFQNSVGSLMPAARKRALIDLLAPRGIPIIEDDIHGNLQHQGSRPRCLKAFDPDGPVLLCSSFSKTPAPGYRVGGRWQEWLLRLKKNSPLANVTLPTLAVAEFLKRGGYDRHLRTATLPGVWPG